jgi:hypothetical protein
MATTGLSTGERIFRQAYALRILLALLLLGLLIGIWASLDDPRPSSNPILSWISLGAVLVYVALWIAIGKTVLTISDQGVRRDSIFGTQEIAWSQIAETRYLVRPVNAAAHFGLIGALVMVAGKSSSVNLTLTLVSREGARLKVNSNFKKVKEAAGIILGRVLPPMVAAARAKVQRGETVLFGSLSLSAANLVWKNQPPIPLSELTRAEIAGTNLKIKRTGKWTSAISVRSDKVPDVLVFLEVLESVAPQLKSSEIDPLARVRL